MLELSIIKTLLMKPSLVNMTFDIINASMFKIHAEELGVLLEGQKEHSSLMRLLMREDIPVYEESDLINALVPFLITFYEDELKKIIKASELSFEKKSFFIRKIQDTIARLKKGELVSYESFGTF
jgi:DNA primase